LEILHQVFLMHLLHRYWGKILLKLLLGMITNGDQTLFELVKLW
jgi:hypothetical protein